MSQERLLNTILSPHMSEKANIAKEKRREYVFHVAKSATKKVVKKAIEELFKTKVSSVTIVNVKGKSKRFRNIQGYSKPWKKAYVTLEAGQAIEFVSA